MSLPPTKAATKKKLITWDYTEEPETYAKFLVKLRHFGVSTPGKFFRSMIRAYLDGNSTICDYLEKELFPQIGSTGRTTRAQKIRSEAAEETIETNRKDNEYKFGLLNEEDIDSIFDILEKEEEKE
jgi:hypothetical protein